MATWTVVVERGPSGWGAYVPALPGLGVAAATRSEVEELIRDGIALHIEGLVADGLPVPDPSSAEALAIAV